MDKPIPKIEGITIERRPRCPIIPNLPRGVTIQRHPNSKEEQFDEEYDEEEEEDEDEYYDDEEILESHPNNESTIKISSEEAFKVPSGASFHRKDLKHASVAELSKVFQPQFQPQIQLPPGITLQRKTKPFNVSYKMNEEDMKLPPPVIPNIPGILIEKKRIEKVKPYVSELKVDNDNNKIGSSSNSAMTKATGSIKPQEDRDFEDHQRLGEDPNTTSLQETKTSIERGDIESKNIPPEVSEFPETSDANISSDENLKTEKAANTPSSLNISDDKIDENADIQDLMDLMTKGEIEGEIEDEEMEEEEDEDDEGRKRKIDEEEEEEEDEEEEDNLDSPKSKKSRKDDKGDTDEEKKKDDIDKSKVTGAHLRKNIREVMDETKLDEATLAAQRQEAERLKRLQEQQRIIREVQRQIEQSKHNDKVHSRMLSMLTNSETSILKTSSMLREKEPPKETSNEPSLSLKLSNGQQTSINNQVLALLKSSQQKDKQQQQMSGAKNLVRQAMLSSSVTIAPIKKDKIEDIDKSKKKKGDVVTLSSDDSDDDCIVLSDDDKESEPDEDPTNSGMHTTDRYNVKDEQGRVLVNVGHPSEEPDLFLAPQISAIIKPHQIGGIRFLYDNIIESVSRFENSEGFGCILAHSMGLGKTLQIVSFSDIFLRHTSGRKILCILPINTIQNWQSEYNMWLPKDTPPETLIEPRGFDIYIVNESHKNVNSRGKVILDWHKNGGVLLMGYELFRLLSLRKPVKSKRKKPDEAEIEKNRNLVEDIYSALVNPGPDLVICDEGHRIKNSHATTSQALKNIRTKRRIVLTGYPLQNNLMEYWCMVDFVRPNYLGTRTEFSNMFERPIQNGQCIDSTPQDIRLMRYRAHVLHSLLEGFVQRRSHAVLQSVLPEKREYVMLLRFTSFQRKLYDTFMNEVVRKVAVPNPLKAFAVCCKIWNHPDVLYNFLKKKGESIDLDLEEALPTSMGPPRYPLENPPANQLPWMAKKAPGRPKKGRPPSKKTLAETEKKSNQNPTPVQQPLTANFPNPANTNANFSNSPFNNQPDANFFNQSDQQQYQEHFDPTNFPNAEYNNYNNSNFYQQNQQHQQQSTYQQQSDNNSQFAYYSQQSQQPSDNRNYEYNQQQSEFSTNYPDNAYDSSYSSSQSESNMTQYSQQNYWAANQDQSQQSGQWSNFSSTNFGGFSGSEGKKSDFQPEEGGIFGIVNREEGSKEIEGKADVKKEEIPYDWATELFKNYVTGVIENSSKMEVFFTIVNESVKRQDRLLVFSQSLLTLDLIEDYLQCRQIPATVKEEPDSEIKSEEKWSKNRNYFRLDGSTGALEREKLINEFNANASVHLFLVSTRAGSLGINLVGANRVIVFDASWNPCHDTQAVCRVYRYGQQKPCYVYRLVIDSCLEKKIYDRQINKQGMADRVVDELNPDAHLSIKEVTNLCWDDQPETPVKDFSSTASKYDDDIIKLLVTQHSNIFSRAPFQHESLLIDRKEKKLSQAEKRLAKRSYELEKQAATQPKNLYQFYPNPMMSNMRGSKPIASVKPMQSQMGRFGPMSSKSKWIPVDVWQKQGMSAQEMTLPLDVVIPTNTPDKSSIVLKAGQRVMVLKSPKGIYMQLETGKIIAIRTAFKVNDNKMVDEKKNVGSSIASVLKNNPNVTITPKSSSSASSSPSSSYSRLNPLARNPLMMKSPHYINALDKKAAAVNMAASKGRIVGTHKKTSPGTMLPSTGPSLSSRKSSTVVRNPLTPQTRMESNPLTQQQLQASNCSASDGEFGSVGEQNDANSGNDRGDSTSAQQSNVDIQTLRDTMLNELQESSFIDPTREESPRKPLGNYTNPAKEPEVTKKVTETSTQPSQQPSTTNPAKQDPVPWPPHQPYPANYPYPPGYPYGYPPMPGYEGYYQPPSYPPRKIDDPPPPHPYPPYPYAPHPPKPVDQSDSPTPPFPPYPPYGPLPPVKTEVGTEGAVPTAAPHPYPPPYPPYHYPYPNYPPYPPPTQTGKPPESAVPPPYAAPGYYPPHYPNYPYPPNYPYGYPPGYPMQNPQSGKAEQPPSSSAT